MLGTLWGLLATYTLTILAIRVLDTLGVNPGPIWPQLVELVKKYDPVVLLMKPNIAILLLVLTSVTFLALIRNTRKEAWF